MRQVFASGPEEQPVPRSATGAGPASPSAPWPDPSGGPAEQPPPDGGDDGRPARPDNGSTPEPGTTHGPDDAPKGGAGHDGTGAGPPQYGPGHGFPPPAPAAGQRFLAPPQRPPATRQPRKPPEKETQQRGWSALALGLLSLLGLSAVQDLGHAYYVLVLTLVIGAAGIWLGASAASRARRGGTFLPRGAVSGIVLGGFGLTLSVIMLAGFALLSTQLSTYSDCMKGANTVSAQQACQDQFTQAVHNKINQIQPSAGR